MPDDDPKLPPLPPGVPRPPSPADLDQVSDQQGMVSDEWAGEPPPERPIAPPVPLPGD